MHIENSPSILHMYIISEVTYCSRPKCSECSLVINLGAYYYAILFVRNYNINMMSNNILIVALYLLMLCSYL